MIEQAFGKYRLRELLARGGMAEIHLAVEQTVHTGERLVVLKRILPEHKDDPDFVEFFVHEARVALQLTHPNIVQAYEFGREEDVLYLAMEYVRGFTVLDVIRRASMLGRHVSLDAVIKVAADVAAGLDYAHKASDAQGNPLEIVHRDVSPHNIVIAREGIAKLVDFGIARASCQAFKTRTGVIKGKFAYLAPEQLRRNARFDHRADLFALGTVTYEMLTRRPLFRGSNDADTVKRILSGRIPPLRELRPDCPAAIAAVVHRALERDPAARYSSGAALLSDLEEAARESGVFPTTTRLRGELETLFEEAAPTSIWTSMSGRPASRSSDAVPAASPVPDSRPPRAAPRASPMPSPTGAAAGSLVRPRRSSATGLQRPASQALPRSSSPAHGALPARPGTAGMPGATTRRTTSNGMGAASAGSAGASTSGDSGVTARPTFRPAHDTDVVAPRVTALAPVLPGPFTMLTPDEFPLPMVAPPRLSSPRLEDVSPDPIPDRQLEYFLRLASARRSRADTVGLADSSPDARLNDESLAMLFQAEQQANADAPGEPEENEPEQQLLGAVPEPTLPVDTAPVTTLIPSRKLDSRSAAERQHHLPLPAPPHLTPPPRLERPAPRAAAEIIELALPPSPPPIGMRPSPVLRSFDTGSITPIPMPHLAAPPFQPFGPPFEVMASSGTFEVVATGSPDSFPILLARRRRRQRLLLGAALATLGFAVFAAVAYGWLLG